MISADTNIFVYLHDSQERTKQDSARQVVAALIDRQALVGLQVVGELQNVLRRKLKRSALEAAQAARNVMASFRMFPATAWASGEALSQLAAGRMSYWDALLIFSAAEAGVDLLLSEDLQDGAVIAGVRIVNPFGSGGAITPAAREVLEFR